MGRAKDPVEFQKLQEGEVGEGRHPILTSRLRARLQRSLTLRLHHDSTARFARIVNRKTPKLSFWDTTSDCGHILREFPFASWRMNIVDV